MRHRNQILDSLERVYREAFESANERENAEDQRDLDFEFQRDQLHLEVLLDIRDILAAAPRESGAGEGVGGILDTAQKLKNLTRLR